MRTQYALGNRGLGRVLERNTAAQLVAAANERAGRLRGGPPVTRQGARSDNVASVRADLDALAQEGARAESGERSNGSLDGLVIDQQFGHLLSGIVGRPPDMGEAYAGCSEAGNSFSDLRLHRYVPGRLRRSKPSWTTDTTSSPCCV